MDSTALSCVRVCKSEAQLENCSKKKSENILVFHTHAHLKKVTLYR